MTLAVYACDPARTRGRRHPEAAPPTRTEYQRDRDRIIHCKAFRRLKHKTQVFFAPAGDHYRTRLTHTLEVSQIARTIAKVLRLHEELTEAIALGHDLGHTPFGHLGEQALSPFLGRPFRHSEQMLLVVDYLERDGEGLNLSWEVRDGIVNHPWSMPPPSTLEAQIVRFADRIAYINHDVDDALRARIGRVAVEQAIDVAQQHDSVRAGGLGHARRQPIVVPEPNFRSGDAVVFVDHGDRSMFEQPG